MTIVKRLPGVAAWLGLGLLLAFLPHGAFGVATGIVQGTVYRADGSVATGTLLLSWPAFATRANEAIASGSKTVAIGADGWLSVSLAPNAGATPNGTYYTAVYHLKGGTTSTEYWVVPSSGTVSLASVRATLMPVAVPVQPVTRQYVDDSISGIGSTFVQATGGAMTGPLNVPMVNGKAFPGAGTLQQAITAAGTSGSLEIPAGYTGRDSFTNPNNIAVTDLRVDVPVNARNVKEFGAKCDGSTSDTAAIQAAFDYAFDHNGGPISFPAGNCILTSPIQYRGESFFGLSTIQSRITGPVGDDMFVSSDPADGTSSRKCCFLYAHVHDITLYPDRSTDPTSTAAWSAKGRGAGQGSIFANTIAGWAGQTLSAGMGVPDTTIGLSVVLPLTQDYKANYHAGYAPFGWVKVDSEFMSYQGYATTGCVGGAPSCLLNVKRGITLAGVSTTAVVHATGAAIVPVDPIAPANVTDWLPAFSVGGCAFAFPGRDGRGSAPAHGWFDHITFGQSSNAVNSSCGFYFQGPPYGMHFSQIYEMGLEYGIVVAPPFTNLDAYLSAAPSADGTIFRELDLNSRVPFVDFLGQFNSLSDSTFYAAGWGGKAPVGFTMHLVPCHVYANGCQDMAPGSWTVNNLYEEPNNGGGAVTDYPPYAQISTSGTKITGGFMGVAGNVGIAPIVLDGNENTFTAGLGLCGTPGIQVNGTRNTVTTAAPICVQNNGVQTIISGAAQYSFANQYALPVRALPNTISTDFLMTGNTAASTAYQSQNDLFITPDMLVGAFNSLGDGVIRQDATAPVTGKYINAPAAMGLAGFRILGVTDFLKVGTVFPATKGIFHAMARAASNTVQIFVISNNHASHADYYYCTLPAGVWTDCTFTYDATSYAVGDTVAMNGNDPNRGGVTTANPPVDVNFAWFAFVPSTNTLNVKQLNATNISGTTASLQSATIPILMGGSISSNGEMWNGDGCPHTALDATCTELWDYDATNIVGVFPATGGYFQMDNEIIGYTNMDHRGDGQPMYHNLTRGMFGTTAVAHAWNNTMTLLSFGLQIGNSLPIYCFGLSKCGASGVWDANQFVSTAIQGTAPIAVTSTTPVANLTLANISQLPAIASTNLTDASSLLRVGTMASTDLTDSSALARLGSLASTNLSDANTIVHTATPTAGKATCVKSVGPPMTIGYCSSAVDAAGACTCN